MRYNVDPAVIIMPVKYKIKKTQWGIKEKKQGQLKSCETWLETSGGWYKWKDIDTDTYNIKYFGIEYSSKSWKFRSWWSHNAFLYFYKIADTKKWQLLKSCPCWFQYNI